MDRNLDAEAYFRRSRDFQTLSQFDQTIIFCKRTLKIKPNHYNAHLRWGASLNDKDLYEKSAKKHKEIICRNLRSHIAYNNFGLALEKQNKLLEAEIQYRKSSEIDPSYQTCLHNLAIVLTKQRKYAQALEKFEKILLAGHQDSRASTLSCHGYLKFILGKYEEGIESFEKAIQQDSNLSLPYFNKALALYCMGKQELAIQVFQETLKKFANSQGWHTRLQRTIGIYNGELRLSRELFEDVSFGEINKEQLIINMKGLEFILNLLKQE